MYFNVALETPFKMIIQFRRYAAVYLNSIEMKQIPTNVVPHVFYVP